MTKLLPILVFLILVPTSAYAESVLYDNGTGGGFPTVTSGYNLGYLRESGVTNSFLITSSSTVTSVNFWTLAFPGAVPQTIEWAITSGPFGEFFGGSTIAFGSANLNYNLISPGYLSGYDFGVNTFSVPSLVLGPGTYWLWLQTPNVTPGSPCCSDINPPNTLYWATNNGPSQADQAVGLIQFSHTYSSVPSEAFQILGPTTVPEPTTLVLLGITVPAVLAFTKKARR
jgi:hypothetical protein